MTTDEKLRSLIPEVTGFELNDVLLAIPKEKNLYISSWTGAINIWSRQTGEMIYQQMNYDLTKSLFNQSDETKQFIINLLK